MTYYTSVILVYTVEYRMHALLKTICLFLLMNILCLLNVTGLYILAKSRLLS